MAGSGNRRRGGQWTSLAVDAREIARAGAGGSGAAGRGAEARGYVGTGIGYDRSDALAAGERRMLRRRTALALAALAVLAFLSLGLTGAGEGGGVPYARSENYTYYGPAETLRTLWAYAYCALGDITHLWSPLSPVETEQYPLWYALPHRAGVVVITAACGLLLAVAGMLYQNAFKNPIAGPGMLGVSTGVSLGNMALVAAYGAGAAAQRVPRLALCYGLGVLVLAFVVLAGKKLSGRGRPYDIVIMLLVGSLLSQLVGTVVSFYTLYIMDPGDYQVYYEVSQQVLVDTSPIAWCALAVAAAASLAPVWRSRFQLNALAFDEAEVRMMGLDPTGLRALALVCGAVMMLAAQIHVGAVALVSLVVPFLSRSLFGCEFRRQLAGNLCIAPVLLLACRDIADAVPFVGDGLALGSVVSVAALPLFVAIMALHMRGWE